MIREDINLVAAMGAAAVGVGAVGVAVRAWWAAVLFLAVGVTALAMAWVESRRLNRPDADPLATEHIPSAAELEMWFRLDLTAGPDDREASR